MVLIHGRAACLLLLLTISGVALAQDDLSPAERAVQDLHAERADDLQRIDGLKDRARAGLSDYSLGSTSDPLADAEVPEDFERTASPMGDDEEGGTTAWLVWPLVLVIAGGALFLVRRWWRGEDY